MRRGDAQLSRVTPLARETPLSNGTQLRRDTPIRQVSDKRKEENKTRRAVIAAAYPETPPCSVPWCTCLADDAHERLSRARGGSITDLRNIAPLCRPHHTEITDTEPIWAYALGLLRSSHPLDAAVFDRKPPGRVRATASLAERLWAGIDASGGVDACWPWMQLVSDKGYGRIGSRDFAYQVMWRVVNGPVPAGKIIRHSCDNPPCCNPAHLLPGTHAENSRDMVERGREPHVRWPANGRSKLSDDQVSQIRVRHEAGATLAALAAEYSVHHAYLSRLVRGQRR